MLLSCASNPLRDQGLALIDQGQVIEGLAKLKAAAEAKPQDLSLRLEYITKREQILQGLLTQAQSEQSAGRLDAASEYYQQVLQIDSEDPRAKAGLANLERDRRHADELTQAQAGL